MRKPANAALHIALWLIVLGGLAAQFLIPLVARDAVWQYPEYPILGRLWLPYSIAAILAILCGQIAVGIIWRLLQLVSNGTIFTAPTAKYINGIILCFGVATALSVIVSLAQIILPDAGTFTTLGFSLGAATVGLALTLLMIVMRDLLSAAVEYRGELDSVI